MTFAFFVYTPTLSSLKRSHSTNALGRTPTDKPRLLSNINKDEAFTFWDLTRGLPYTAIFYALGANSFRVLLSYASSQEYIEHLSHLTENEVL